MAKRRRGPSTTHNMCYTPEYRKFAALLYQSRQAGRPIAEGWDEFMAFWQELGRCPRGHVAFMKDKSVGMAPGNIVWVRRYSRRKKRKPPPRVLSQEAVTVGREAFLLKL